MKKLIVCLLCIAVFLSACATTAAPAAMKLEQISVSGSIYGYYLACYKQYWLSALGQTDDLKFWNTENEGMKNADRLTQISEDAIKKRIAANYLFESYGLQLTDEEYDSIDMLITSIGSSPNGENGIEDDEVFKELGLKSEDLRTIMIMDSKVGALQDYLYGQNGVRTVTDEAKEEYYRENYRRFKMVYLMNCDFVRDEDGNIVYNEDGVAKTKEITEDRYNEKLGTAKDILSKVRAGEDIDKYIEEYSEELEKDDYKNGHYLCSVNSYGALLSGAVMKLGIGETGLLDTKISGIYVIQRLDLDAGAWANEENKAGEDFYNFEVLVLEKDFDDLLQPYCDKVQTDTSVTEKYKMEELPYTFSWQYIF